MRWVRRHPFAAGVFAVIFVFFVFAAIVGDEDEDRTDAILGLILIYLFLIGLYALGAWLYGKISGPKRQDTIPPVPPFPHQQFPQWDWSARPAMVPSGPAPVPTAITCRQCGAINPPDAAFCDQCGARLTIPAPPPLPSPMPLTPPMPTAEDAIECPRCHTKQSSRVRYCTNCGLPRSSV